MQHLARARSVFAELGTKHLRGRADRGLDLAFTSPRTTPNWSDLTSQESEVAKLAATDLTNRQIAAELFISPRIVGHHLSSVFAKLGIASRQQLLTEGHDAGRD